jgi:hypothetical protein
VHLQTRKQEGYTDAYAGKTEEDDGFPTYSTVLVSA